MKTLPTPETRAKHLADAKQHYEQDKEAMASASWEEFLESYREQIASATTLTRGEFMLFMITEGGCPPEWADAIATEVGVAEFSQDAQDFVAATAH